MIIINNYKCSSVHRATVFRGCVLGEVFVGLVSGRVTVRISHHPRHLHPQQAILGDATRSTVTAFYIQNLPCER